MNCAQAIGLQKQLGKCNVETGKGHRTQCVSHRVGPERITLLLGKSVASGLACWEEGRRFRGGYLSPGQ